MPGKIFINYRRGDDAGFTGRLFDFLEQKFSSGQLFIDVDNIAAGDDFMGVLEAQVAQSDVMLSVIGRDWLDASDESGRRRLDSVNDFVRIEIESAMRLGKRVIPVLVNNAAMPKDDELPPSLAPLSRRNAVRLSHERFRPDAQGLVSVLTRALAEAESARKVAAKRAAEEAERRQIAPHEAEGLSDPQAEVAELERRIAEIKAREARRPSASTAEPQIAGPSVPAATGRVEAAQAAKPSAPVNAARESRASEVADSTVASDHHQGAIATSSALGSKELSSGLLFIGLGAIGFAAGPGFAVTSGTSAVPVGIACALILVGVLSLLKAVAGTKELIDPIAWRAVIFPIASCALFGALVQGAGLIAALTALGAVSMAAAPSGYFDWRALATYAVFLGSTTLIFVWGLKQPIPLVGPWLGG